MVVPKPSVQRFAMASVNGDGSVNHSVRMNRYVSETRCRFVEIGNGCFLAS